MRKLFVLVMAFLSGLVSAGEFDPDPNDITPLISQSGTGTTWNWAQWGSGPIGRTVGIAFHVNQAIIVNAIGSSEVGDRNNSDGIPTYGMHSILLFDESGNRVAGALAGGSGETYGTVIGNFSYATPYSYATGTSGSFLLSPGDYYLVGYGYGRWNRDHRYETVTSGYQTDPALTVTGSVFGASNDLFGNSISHAVSQEIYVPVVLSGVLAVPEPQTYGMVLFGLGLIGVVRGRRRK